MDLAKGIWDRDGKDEMGSLAYTFLVSFFFILNLLIVTIGSAVTYTWEFSWGLVIASFLIALVSIFIFQGSDNWIVSELGVGAMSASLGAMIGSAFHLYKLDSVLSILALTLVVTVACSITGLLLVASGTNLTSGGGILLQILGILLIGNVLRMFLPAFGIAADLKWLDWIGVLLFSAYTVYEWNRAMFLPKTINNAVDTSGALVLDAVNIFLNLLSIFGVKNDD